MTGVLLPVLAWALAAQAPVAVDARGESGLLTVQMGAPGTASREFSATLKDGLTHRVRYTLSVRAEERGAPVVLTEILLTEVVYDLWAEAFVVTHSEGGKLRRVRVKSVERVQAILDAPRFRTGVPVAGFDPRRRWLADLRVEVNPVSEEVLTRTRELLSPPPRDSDTGAARSLLGSVARVFVNESSAGTGNAELLFTSRPFVVQQAPGGTP